MTTKVSIERRWTGPIPLDKKGQPIPRHMWPRRRKHRWRVRWFAPGLNGRMVRPSRSFETREEAERLRAVKQAEFDRSPSTRVVVKNVTIGEFIDEFVRHRTGPRGQSLKARSLQASRQSLARFAAYVGTDRRLVDIDARDAAKFISSLRNQQPKHKKLSPSTINKFKEKLKAAFNVAIRPMCYINDNPFAGMRGDRVPDSPVRYITAEEFSGLLDACDEMPHERSLWWRTFLMVAYTAGLRRDEIVHLTWKDLDFEADTISVTSKTDDRDTIEWMPKDYESRIIPVPPAMMALLADMQAVAENGHSYVFLPADRLRLIKDAKSAGTWKEDRAVLNNFSRSFRKLVRLAAKNIKSIVDGDGKPAIGMHDLRRTAITNWSRAANIQTVMRMAGHSNVSTTQKFYAATTKDQLEQIRISSQRAVQEATEVQTDPKMTHSGHPETVFGPEKTANVFDGKEL